MGAKFECFYCHEIFPVEERIDGFKEGYSIGFLCPHCGRNIKDNLLIPSSGLDESNAFGQYVLWPEDPQGVANQVRAHLCRRFSLRHVGVIVTDSKTTPLRLGVTGVAIAHSGSQMVQQTIRGMDTIRDQIQDTSKRIKRLGESSQEIGDIVELINGIAEQTNILALNAAIQSASAGGAGRGFAVVADEVQRLAERATNATRRIEMLVQNIQADTAEAVVSMESTTSEVVSGAEKAEDAGEALKRIESVSKDLSAMIESIAQEAQTQSETATRVAGQMNSIRDVSIQTYEGSNQTAQSMGRLADLVQKLSDSVADFKLPEERGTGE